MIMMKTCQSGKPHLDPSRDFSIRRVMMVKAENPTRHEEGTGYLYHSHSVVHSHQWYCFRRGRHVFSDEKEEET